MRLQIWFGVGVSAALGLAMACGGDDDGGGDVPPGSKTKTADGGDGEDGGGGSSGDPDGGEGGAARPDAGVIPGLYDCRPPSGSVNLKLTEVASGFDTPLWVGSPPADTSRLFVVEQPGVIRVIKGGQTLPTPFLDIRSKVVAGGERGLLGLAFHPDYENNGRLFVHYSNKAKDGDTMIEEYKRGSNPDVADPAGVQTVLTQAQPQSNHNGGALHFGPDGMLYIGLGDGGGGGDQHGTKGNGQSLDTLLAKILRIDVNAPSGDKAYGIPAGNMTGTGVRPEIWSYGLRNPWRWSFDACTGDMYIADVGQNAFEEINVEPAGKGSGTNYGWRVMEASKCYDPPSGCDQSGKQLPVAEYSHSEGCSVTGGFVYRGKNIPALRGTYLYADYCTKRFFSFVWSGGQATNKAEITSDITSASAGSIGQVSSFGQDVTGEVYVTDFDGKVWRIDAE